jgi:hypothetical protein
VSLIPILVAKYLGADSDVARLLARAILALGIASLGYAMLGARHRWNASPTTSFAGTLGAAAIVLAIACPGLKSQVRLGFAGIGVPLISFGLIGLITSSMPPRARTAAGACGVLVAAMLTAPLPYLGSTHEAITIQLTILLVAAAGSLVTLSVSTRQSSSTTTIPALEPTTISGDDDASTVTLLRSTLTPTARRADEQAEETRQPQTEVRRQPQPES